MKNTDFTSTIFSLQTHTVICNLKQKIAHIFDSIKEHKQFFSSFNLWNHNHNYSTHTDYSWILSDLNVNLNASSASLVLALKSVDGA